MKCPIVSLTLNLSRQPHRERLCVTVSSEESRKKRMKRSEIIQAMPPAGARGGAWLPGTMAHSSCCRDAQPHASANIQVRAKPVRARAHGPGSWARTELCIFQENLSEANPTTLNPLNRLITVDSLTSKGLCEHRGVSTSSEIGVES